MNAIQPQPQPRRSTPISLTLDEARATRWPFRDFRGQSIGGLIDNGTIALKDLAFAAERAFGPRVQAASKVILLHTLTQKSDEPKTVVGPLNVISSQWRSFSESRQIQIALIEGLIMGMALATSIALFLNSLLNRPERTPEEQQRIEMLQYNPQVVLLAIGMVLGVIWLVLFAFYLLDKIMNALDRQAQLHRKGQRGEERILNAMYRYLDGNWWLFKNLEFPKQKKGDIDFVLVGPTGVWALEVKSYGGEYRTIGDQWERRFRSRWLPAFKNPTRQAKRNAAALSHILQTHNLKQWITPVVVWANPEAKLSVENPSILVWNLDKLATELRTLHDTRPITDDHKTRIVEVLKGLYDKPLTSDDFNQSEIE